MSPPKTAGLYAILVPGWRLLTFRALYFGQAETFNADLLKSHPRHAEWLTIAGTDWNLYIATHDNPGYDPTISTWFWSPFSCGGGGGGGGGGGSSCSAPAWSSSQVYVGGNMVTFNGHAWRAKWWTQGERPGAADVWADQGSC